MPDSKDCVQGFGSENMTSEQCNTGSGPDRSSQAVSIDASRIYDSCGAKDCLNDLQLLFTEENQALVNAACSVRILKATVITATVDVEPVAFHRGFYAVDMMFYFDVSCDVYASSSSIPSTVNGLAMYGKRVVLYGSESCAKTFTSEDEVKCSVNEDCPCSSDTACRVLPKATVQISNPMALSAKLSDRVSCHTPCTNVPQCVIDYFGGDFVPPRPNQITVTIGIFTITQLERNVQMMIPSYDFCVPRRECTAKTDDPCEVFSKIEFPTASFFPPNVAQRDREERPFEGCSCRE